METKWFFDNTGKDLALELEAIDVNKHKLFFEPFVPGDEEIGELNEYEKKIAIQLSLMGTKLQQVQLSKEDFADPISLMR